MVARFWGGEDELTKEAYARVNGSTGPVTVIYKDDSGEETQETFDSIKALKNEIIELKLTGRDNTRLMKLLGGFTGMVNCEKELMVN